MALLPILGDANVSFAEQVLAYAPAVVLVFGLLALAGGAAPAPLALLFLADAGRICFAAALARHVNSIGVAFLVAAVAAADQFSPSSPALPGPS